MNLLDKAISDVKQRKLKKNQENTTPTLGNNAVFTEGEKLSRDAQYISDYAVETPIHLDENAYNVINTYRGSYKTTANQLDGAADKDGNAYVYETVVSPSLFNPFYGVNSAGISPGIPLLDNIANNTNISAAGPDGKKTINKQTLLIKL